MPVKSYRDLKVWQESMQLAAEIYAITSKFPREESYGLAFQMKKAAVSMPSNIAEGYRRSSRRDYRNFLFISFGSGAELETQIELVKKTSWGKALDFDTIDLSLGKVMRMLNVLIRKLGT